MYMCGNMGVKGRVGSGRANLQVLYAVRNPCSARVLRRAGARARPEKCLDTAGEYRVYRAPIECECELSGTRV